LGLAPPRSDVASAPGETLLVAEGLRAGYGADTVLRDVDLHIRQGEVVAIMGRNGAGKTTLLRCMAGVHELASGRVQAAGGRAPRPGIDAALCPQEPESILFKDSVADEIRTTLHARGKAESPVDILDRFGLAGLAGRHPRDLSAGQRLLVATAAVVAADAPVLLLDEPTRGLDPESKEALATFMRAFASTGRAAVIATHDVELAAASATRVVLLAGGEVIAEGSPDHVLGDSQVFAPQMTRVFGPGWLTPEQVAAAVIPA